MFPCALRTFWVLSNSNLSAAILIPSAVEILPRFFPIILLPPSKISNSETSNDSYTSGDDTTETIVAVSLAF